MWIKNNVDFTLRLTVLRPNKNFIYVIPWLISFEIDQQTFFFPLVLHSILEELKIAKIKLILFVKKTFQVAFALCGYSCAGNTCDPFYNLVCIFGICECLSSAYWMNILNQCGNI